MELLQFTPFIWTLIACLFTSLFSFIGAITLVVKREVLNKFLKVFVGLSAGTLLGGAFLHLIPEASETIEVREINFIVLIAFISLFLFEKTIHWHHHHDVVHDKHTIGYMNLFADSFHNFLDGIVIATAFVADFNLGIATTFAVILHEIPQELGDFGVLLHSGFSVKKALLANLFVALSSILGALVGIGFSEYSEQISPLIMAFAAGGFIYIATSDLLPEIRQERHPSRAWISFLAFIFGIGIMIIL